MIHAHAAVEKNIKTVVEDSNNIYSVYKKKCRFTLCETAFL